MTGGPEITVRIAVYCGSDSCIDPYATQKTQAMKLDNDDVEDGRTGRYVCPRCDNHILVELNVGNEHR